jgi:TolB-like protein
MTQKTKSFERFWRELKRRKVVHVITIYAAVAFVILQLVDMVAEPLRLPVSTKALVIVLLCIGFVISVFVSWVYDITPAGVKKTKPVSTIKHSYKAAVPTSSGWKITSYVSALVIIALIAFNFISRKNLNSDISKLEKSIAVLPFENDSPDTTNLYFCNGMMDEILTQLQKIGGLKVKSRTSGERYRHPNKDIRDIGKELGVSFIVEGSVRKVNDALRITTQLINAKTGNQVWADTYNGKYTDKIFEFQSNVAKKVAASLNAVITPEEKQLIEKIPTANLKAYDYYQRGKEEERKFSLTNLSAFSNFSIMGSADNPTNIQPIERARKMYNTALKYDSAFALAYVGLASVYWNKNYYKEYFSKNFLDSVLYLAEKALSLDDQLSDAHNIMGMYYEEKGNGSQALEEYDKAIEFNPNDWMAYYKKGDIKSLQKAVSLNHGPELPFIIGTLAMSYIDFGFVEKADSNLEYLKLIGEPIQYLNFAAYGEHKQGHWEKTIELSKKVFDIDSTNIESLEMLGYCYSFIGQFKESLKYYKKYVESQKASGQLAFIFSHRIGYAYFKNGYKKEAEYYLEKQIEYCNGQIKLNRPWAQELYPYYDLAGVYAFKGDKVKAYKNLKNYNQRKEPEGLWMVSLIKTDPLFNSIRNEPEFQQIVRDVEARQQALHERVKEQLKEQGML